MIRIRVALMGGLQRRAEDASRALELDEGARVAEALHAVGLPDRVDVWALRNGSRVGREERLADGDDLVFFQPTGGG